MQTGTRSGVPKANTTLRWTAGDMLHLVPSSVELIGQLMTEQQKQHDVWRSWILHVDYFLLLLQVSFTTASLELLQQRIIIAHQAFLAVPEFNKLWTPKHHFSLHFVEDIKRFGPPRFYWCMRFESKNKEHKMVAKTCGFQNIPGDR